MKITILHIKTFSDVAAHKYERSFMVSDALDTRASYKSHTEAGGIG